MNNFFFIKICIIIICIYSSCVNLSNIYKFISYIKIKNDIKNLVSFFRFCNDKFKKLFFNITIAQYHYLEKIVLLYLGKLKVEIRKIFKKMKKPAVSVISPIYNRGRFLKTFLKSIQHQSFDNIEIIFIDDKSTDNSAKILEKYQKEDKRIKIIKLKRNKGTLFVRNIGVLYSKAKYIILSDPDDIISKDLISICLYYAEKYKFEIIKFFSYTGNKKEIKYVNEIETRPLYQPELQTYLFYGNNELEKNDFGINNKMIRKKLFIKVLNSLNNFYLNIYMTFLEDQLINFLLYKNAKSFYILKKFGNYYKRNTISICNNIFKLGQMKMKFYFIYLRLVIEYTKNTKFEKDMVNYVFTKINKRFNIEKKIFSSFSNDDFNFYCDIINMLLNCKFTSAKNYLLLLKLKNIIQIKNQTFINSIKKQIYK